MADTNNNVVNVTDLEQAGALQDGDTLLLIRKTDTGQACYRIAGSDFRGKTAYEVAQEMGFAGSYADWQAQLSKVSSFGVDFDPDEGTINID